MTRSSPPSQKSELETLVCALLWVVAAVENGLVAAKARARGWEAGECELSALSSGPRHCGIAHEARRQFLARGDSKFLGWGDRPWWWGGGVPPYWNDLDSDAIYA